MNGPLAGRTAYLAQPIDLTVLTNDQRYEVTEARRSLVVHGAVVFSPRGAFSLDVDYAGMPTPTIERINRMALTQADLLVACFPESGSIGVPMEIARAQDLGIPTVVITDAADRSYALAGLDPEITRIGSRLELGLLGWLVVQPRRGGEGRPPLLFKMDDPALLPTHAHPDDAGFDLVTSAETKIEPGQFADVPCGCAVQLPDGVWAMVTGRSSTIRKHQLLVNPGIIDTGYRGPLFAGTWNLGPDPFVVPVGMRIAQFIPLPNVAAGLVATMTDRLEPSARGTNGFGSTGSGSVPALGGSRRV